jgi:hypothetical protein
MQIANHNRLTVREEPDAMRRDIVTRAISVRAATIDAEARSVEVTMATESPVTVFDWEREQVIDEVLRADGGEFPEQLPLLESHMRWSVDSILGSVRNLRRDVVAGSPAWAGRAFLARDDQRADMAWNKIRQGHLTDVSVGYRVLDAVMIPAGSKQTIDGREYAAGSRPLRVARRWQARELSLVPIGADPRAKVREEEGGRARGREGGSEPTNSAATGRGKVPMNPQLRKYLESIGLRSDASETDAQAFLSALGGDLRRRADAVEAKTLTLEAAIAEGRAPPAPEGERAGGRENERAGEPATPAADLDNARREAAAAERARIASIRELAGRDIAEELVNRAISEGWDVGRASGEFLRAWRKGGSPPVAHEESRAPGGIVREPELRRSRLVLGTAMAMRALAGANSAMTIEQWGQRTRLADAARREANLPDVAAVLEEAHRYREMSLIEICRECIRLDGGDASGYLRNDEIVERAMLLGARARMESAMTGRSATSGGAVTYVFTTAVNASLLARWEEEPDTTVGWVEEVDVADFKTNTVVDYDDDISLKRLGRGGEAEHSKVSDTGLTYKIYRYAKQATIDDQDIIDDSFNVLVDRPAAFGRACRRLRPDMVYYILMTNAAMADTGLLFNSTALTTAGGHANLTSADIALAALQAARTAMAKQYKLDGSKVIPLNIVPRYLLVPPDIADTAAQLLNSETLTITGTTDSTIGTRNPVFGMATLRQEARLSLGVTDPVTEAEASGDADAWYLAANPGRTLRVAYRRGTGRMPMIRSNVLTQGRWGINFDVNYDLGAAVVDYRGLHKSGGAG